MEHILFSLIVPMYNAEKYIGKCLRSIMAQTFGNFEVLLVDDGSADHTVLRSKAIAGSDGRFKMIENKINKGVSASRNCGLEQAVGEWIWFIDADDWIEPDALERLAQSVTADADMVAFDYVKERRGNVILFENQTNRKQMGHNGFCAGIFDSNFHFQSVWSAVYRHQFLSDYGIRFDENLVLLEDCEYIVRLGRYLKRCVFIKQPLYHYVVNMESASQKWKPGVGEMNVKAAAVISRDVRDLHNEEARARFFHFMQDVIKVAVLKDIFHPNNPLTWNERKMQLNKLLRQKYAQGAIRRPYDGNMAKKIIWFAVVHRCYLLLRVISWMYYCIQGEWFWKLYSKAYGV